MVSIYVRTCCQLVASGRLGYEHTDAFRWTMTTGAEQNCTTGVMPDGHGMDGDVDFLHEALQVLVEGIMDAEVSAQIGAQRGARG